MKHRFILSGVLIANLAACAGIAQDIEVFQQNWLAAADSGAKIEMAKRAISSSEDVDFARKVEDMWKELDLEGVKVYFAELTEKNPDSAKDLYLYGRLQENTLDKLATARKVIGLDPKFVYGYRLLAVPISQALESSGTDAATVNAIREQLRTDLKLIEEGWRLFPDNTELPDYIYDGYGYLKDYKRQMEVLQRLDSVHPDWSNAARYVPAYVGLGELDKAREKLSEYLENAILSGKFEAGDREEATLFYLSDAYFKTEQWDAAIRFLSSCEDEKLIPQTRVDLARVYLHQGEEGKAWEALDEAISLGYDTPGELHRNDEFKPYFETEQWLEKIALIKANRVAHTELRKNETLAGLINLPAPELVMLDADGKIVNLAELKGQVVVIDFWATWCGPCRMAMPEVNKFTRAYAGKGVKVISLDVWENAPDKARQFMKDNDYAMELMWPAGESKPTDVFGVDGIPTLFVIDKNGHIRYKEVGYNEGLEEKLGWFVEELL